MTATTSAPVHHPELQTHIIPFQVPNRNPCTAIITIKPDDNPIFHGQHLVGRYKDAATEAVGYPILHGSISSPQSQTYAALYGWMQITNAPGEEWIMDIYPPFQGLNNPFFIWGAAPTAVDAPGRTCVKDYDWSARTFLCYSPDAAMTKTVVPILAVEWGFWIKDFKPLVKQLKKLDIKTWNGHLDLFRREYEGWTFEEAKA